MYEVHLSQRAKRFLTKLDDYVEAQIVKRLRNLKVEPFPSDSKFINRSFNKKIYRYRVGRFRILYEVIENKNIILITKIDKRSKIYKV